MVGVKMVVLSLIGLGGIVGVNLIFFKLVKNELRKRKFI
jgi:hypothetical protein